MEERYTIENIVIVLRKIHESLQKNNEIQKEIVRQLCSANQIQDPGGDFGIETNDLDKRFPNG